MRRNTSLVLGAAIAVALGAAGCTNSQILDPGNEDVVLDIEVVNSASRYEFAELSISQLNLRPNDPESDVSLGSLPVGVIQTAEQVIEINLNNIPDIQPSTLILSSGSWRLSALQVSNPAFFDLVGAPPATACNQLAFYQFNSVINYTADDLGEAANFDVVLGGKPIRIQIDAAAFIAAFENSWDCLIPPGFPTAFREAQFKALAPTYFRVVQ